MIRSAIAVVVLLSLPACDYFFATTPDYPFLESPAELAVLDGPFDPGAHGDGLVLGVCIRQDGRLVIKSDIVSEDEAVRCLGLFAERERDMDHPFQLSGAWVRICADRRAEWASLVSLLDLCTDPEVRIWKLKLAVRIAGTRRVALLDLHVDPPDRRNGYDVPQRRLVSAEPGLSGPPVVVVAKPSQTVQSVLKSLNPVRREKGTYVLTTEGGRGRER